MKKIILKKFAHLTHKVCSFKNRQAFTLAEVLITLAIIGVVAALSIPVIVKVYKEKVYSTRDKVFQTRLKDAMVFMNSDGKLTGYADTESFVNEFRKYFKISRTCQSSELENCFTDEFNVKAENKKFNLDEVRNSRGLSTYYGTSNMGAVTVDGISMIITYNPDQSKCAPANEFDIQKVLGCIGIMYDLNGKQSPNKTGGNDDIRFLNATLHAGCDGKKIGGLCLSSNIVASSGYYENTCDGKNKWDTTFTSAIDSTNCATNRWAGAKKILRRNT